MKLLVVSDTHGRIEKATAVYQKISAQDHIDAILHCGDYKRDAEDLARRLDVPVYGVTGNCDGGFQSDIQMIPVPSGKILVTHGHLQHVDYGLDEISRFALEQGCTCVCFGHTHVPVCQTSSDGILLVNPGSLTRPRDGSREGSCAMLYVEPEGITASILYYDQVMAADDGTGGSGSAGAPGSSGKKKARGGFLRKLMNYSDSL